MLLVPVCGFWNVVIQLCGGGRGYHKQCSLSRKQSFVAALFNKAMEYKTDDRFLLYFHSAVLWHWISSAFDCKQYCLNNNPGGYDLQKSLRLTENKGENNAFCSV